MAGASRSVLASKQIQSLFKLSDAFSESLAFLGAWLYACGWSSDDASSFFLFLIDFGIFKNAWALYILLTSRK